MEAKGSNYLHKPIADLCALAAEACVQVNELTKKNSELKVELQTTKNMLKEKDQEKLKLKGDFKVEEESKRKESSTIINTLAGHLSDLKDEISQLNSKLDEHREEKSDLKMRNKALTDEIINYKKISNTLQQEMAQMSENFKAQKAEFVKRSDKFCRGMKKNIKIAEKEIKEEIVRTKMKSLEHSIANKNHNVEKISSALNKLEANLKPTCYREFRKRILLAISDAVI